MDSREIFAESGIITSSVSDGPMERTISMGRSPRVGGFMTFSARAGISCGI